MKKIRWITEKESNDVAKSSQTTSKFNYLDMWINYKEGTKFIINDEYVEFRKALAEGKTIQQDVGSASESHWIDNTEPTFKLKSKFYRIKPDEPKFKVGDWITSKENKPMLVTSVQERGINTNKVNWIGNGFLEDYSLWKPQPEELCVFWDPFYKDSYRVARYAKSEEGKHWNEEDYGYFPKIAPLVHSFSIYK